MPPGNLCLFSCSEITSGAISLMERYFVYDNYVIFLSQRDTASKLDSLVSVQIWCEMSIFYRRFLVMTLYSYKNSYVLYQGSFGMCLVKKGTLLVHLLVIIMKIVACAYVKYGLNQFHYCWPLIKGE